MRVALFFDGKNFYSGWKDIAHSDAIDFVKLSRWLVQRVGGSFLWGAYYYTGIESDAGDAASSRLPTFLDMLELQPGFFVYRFPRKRRTTRCAACGTENHFTQEKEVDTTMVADMLRLAAVGAFDILVLMSGDADHSPAVEGVRMLGKQAYVATWSGSGLSSRLRKAAFDHIDLADGLAEFRLAREGAPAADSSVCPADVAGIAPTISDEEAGTGADVTFLAELGFAETKFVGGYVGVNYFVTRWVSTTLDVSAVVRRRILNRLVDTGKIELYDAPNGEKAMRRTT